MKKLLLIILTACFASVTSYADDITDGFYRVVNIGLAELGNSKGVKKVTYCRVADSSIPINKNSGTSQDFEALQMWPGQDEAIASPASVIYIKKSGSGWDLQAQGMSVEQAVKQNSGLGSVNWSMTGNTDACVLSASAMGQTMFLWATKREQGGHYRATTDSPGSDAYKQWKLIKINNDDNYVAIKPRFTIQKDGETKYYAPYFASFAFKVLSKGMKVFYVSEIGKDNYKLKEITSEIIPEKTPVLIECSSENIADNKIEPVAGSHGKIADNKLSGCYFCNPYTNSDTRLTTFNPQTMRAWNVVDGKLVLSNVTSDYYVAAGKGYYIPANESYLTNLPEGTQPVLQENVPVPQITTLEVDTKSTTIEYAKQQNTTVTVTEVAAAVGKTITAVSSNTSVATVTPQAVVNAEGKALFTITSVGVGTANITYTITGSDGTNKTDVTVVTVPEPKVEGMTIDKSNITVAYSATGTVTLTATPSYAAKGKTVTVTSSDNNIATTTSATATFNNDGKATFTIEGKYPGNAVLTFKIDGTEFSATTAVTVTPPAISSIEASDVTATIEKDQSKTVTVTAMPLVVTKGKTIRAVSSNPSIVSVTASSTTNESGKAQFVLTAVGEGTATITYSMDNTDLKATTTVTVPVVQEDMMMINKEAIEIAYLEKADITISALPVDKFAGKTITAKVSNEGIVSLGKTSFTLSNNADAVINIEAKKFGKTTVTFTIDGAELSVKTDINVPVITVPAPTADLASGTLFYKDKATNVSLATTSSENTIYYTNDGSDPKTSSTRVKYSSPIALENTVVINAIAENQKKIQSDVLTLTYTLAQNNDGITLNSGWNWISFNMFNDKLNTYDSMLENGKWATTDEVKTKDEFYDYSTKYKKWFGTLKKSNNNDGKIDGMLKVHSTASQSLNITGYAINPASYSINIEPGWNYIAYLPIVKLNVNDALANYKAKVNDIVKSIDGGAAVYTETGWTGNLTTMEPGKGYMLLHTDASTKTSFNYPSVFPTMTAAKAGFISFNASAETDDTASPNAFLFSGNMNIIANVSNEDVQEGDAIVAIANGEVRGKSVIKDNAEKVVMTIAGDEPANVVLALERDGNIIATAKASVVFNDNDVIGSWTEPTEINFVKNDAATEDAGTINAVYGIDGKLYNGNVNALPKGAYIIQKKNAEGKYSNTKVSKK